MNNFINIVNKPLDEFGKGSDDSDFIQNYDALSMPQQLVILKKRKEEYLNLANYIHKEVMPNIDNKEVLL